VPLQAGHISSTIFGFMRFIRACDSVDELKATHYIFRKMRNNSREVTLNGKVKINHALIGFARNSICDDGV
jgi:hypothetical protein